MRGPEIKLVLSRYSLMYESVLSYENAMHV